MLRCRVCDGNADKLDNVLLNADGDFACSKACAEKYERDKQAFFASLDDDEAYAGWWAAGGVDIKQFGDEAWKMPKEE